MKYNVVGNNIKKLRLKKDITQEELALQSNLSQGYINQLESGKRRYTQKGLELISKALSVPVFEFFTEKEYCSVPMVKENTETFKTKRTSKKGFIELINELPEHVVEHYFLLMTIEKEILEKSFSAKNPAD